MAPDAHDGDEGRDLAQWLEESGHRRAAVAGGESAEELLRYLESLAGTQLRSRDDIFVWVQHLRASNEEKRAREASRRLLREVTLLLLLAAAIAQYYYWDVSLQVASLEKIYYFVPPAAGGKRL